MEKFVTSALVRHLGDGAFAWLGAPFIPVLLARNAKVALNAGNTYGPGGANRARMNIATSRKTLEAALTSLARTLDGLKRSTSAP